jgi:hypothetical protein
VYALGILGSRPMIVEEDITVELSKREPESRIYSTTYVEE